MADLEQIELDVENTEIPFDAEKAISNNVDPIVAQVYASRDSFSIDRGPEPEVDPTEHYQQNLDKSVFSHDSYMQELTQSLIQRQEEEIREFVDSVPADAEELKDPTLIPEVIEKDFEVAAGPLAPEYSIIDSSVPTWVPHENKMEMAANLRFLKIIEKLAGQDRSMWDHITDFAGVMVPDLNYDIWQIDGLDKDNFIENYRALPPEEKVIFQDILVKEVIKHFDSNEDKYIPFLRKLISPTGREDLQFDLNFDAVGVGSSVPFALIAKAGKAAIAGANVIANTADTVRAGVLNAKALEDAAMFGKNQVSAYADGTPFNNNEVLADTTTKSINQETVDALAKVTKEDVLKMRVDAEKFFKTGEDAFVVPHEFEDLEERLISRFESLKKEMQDRLVDAEEGSSLTLQNGEILDSNPDSFRARFDYVNEAGEKGSHEVTIHFGRNDVGAFTAIPDVTGMKGFLASPKYLFREKGLGQTIGRMVETAELRDTVQARYMKAFGKMFEDAVAPITNKLGFINTSSRANLEAVMEAADRLDKRFTIDELLYKGIDTEAGTIHLKPHEANVFYRLMEVGDIEHAMLNQLARTQMARNNEHLFKYGPHQRYAKPITSEDQIDNLKSIYDTTTHKVRDLTEETLDLASMAQENKVIVKLTETIDLKETVDSPIGTYRYIIVDHDLLEELPPWVLQGGRQAYSPNLWKNSNYVVREFSPATINGVTDPQGSFRTVGIFSGPKAADEYLEKMEAVAAAAGNKRTYKRLEDREMSLLDSTSVVDRLSNDRKGAHTGRRSTSFIHRDVGPKLSPFAAMKVNFQYLSSKMARNDWAFDMQNRWMKTVSEATGTHVDNFNVKIDTSTAIGKSLEAQRNYIKQQMQIPDESTVSWEATTRKIADWMEGKSLISQDWNIPGLKNPVNLRKSVLYFSDKDPIATTRAMTFHSLLGWFNPSQLFVQAQNASIAASLSPQHAPGAVAAFRHFRRLMYAPDEKTMRHMLNKYGTTTAEQEDLIASVKAAQRTGYFDALTNTADMSIAMQGYGNTAEAVKKIADKGLWFFMQGEFASRGIAWRIAWEEAKAAGKPMNTNKTIQEVFSRANDFNQNMGRANRAKFQTNNFTAIGTQFWQPTTKFIEKAVLNGSDWSVKDRIKMFTGQFMMYGAAGIPLGDFILNQAAGYFKVQPEDVTEEQLAFFSQGLTGVVFGGGDLQVAPRAALASGIKDIMYDTLLEDSSMIKHFFGASGTMYGRAFDGVTSLMLPMFTDKQWSPEEWAVHASRLPTVLSSLSNAQKAYFMLNSEIYYDRNFNVLMRGKFSPTEIIGQSLGFQITDATFLHKAQLTKKQRTDMQTKFANIIMGNMNRFVALKESNPKEAAEYADFNQHLINMMPPGDRRGIRTKIVNILKKGSKEYPLIFDTITNDTSAAADRIGALRLFLKDEEE